MAEGCTGERPGCCVRPQRQEEAHPCPQLGSKQHGHWREGTSHLRRRWAHLQPQSLLLLPTLLLLLLLGGGGGGWFGPAGAAAQSCSGGVWTGGGSGPLYECSTQLIAYGASTSTNPASGMDAGAGGLAGAPVVTGNCLSGAPTAPAVIASTWYTGNNGNSNANITVGG